MTVAICVPAHRPRLEELIECLAVMDDPDFWFVVVTNEPSPIRSADMGARSNVMVVNTCSEEINLPKWWNVGLQHARHIGADAFMVTESDVHLTAAGVWRLRDAMYAGGYSMVGPNLYGLLGPHEVSVETDTKGWGNRHPGNRICQTWMVRTRDALWADERYAWWHSDEQHEMRHRSLRHGTAVVGSVTYERPLFQTTDPTADPQLDEANARSREQFYQEWGFPTLT